MSSGNTLTLSARLAERQALRLSPAGVPVLDCVLEHQSEQQEAGRMRKVAVRIRAVSLGTVAEQLDRLPLGAEARYQGFVASPVRRQPSHSGTALVYHIQAFQLVASTASSQTVPTP